MDNCKNCPRKGNCPEMDSDDFNCIYERDTMYILCITTKELGIPLVPSIRVKCIDCGEELWMDRNYQLAVPMPTPICLECINKR